MDIIEIQFKRGTVVRDVESGNILKIDYFWDNKVHFTTIKPEHQVQYDYKWMLGKRYIKDKTYKVLYGDK